MYYSLRLISIFVFVCISSALYATDISEDEYRLLESMSFEELLNTDIATGIPMKQKFAPAVTSILTSQEMRTSGARTVHEVLEQVPGLHVYLSNLDSQSPKVSIRGIQTGFNPQVLFLMDGIPLNDLMHGQPGNVFRMPISIIHRIEIIRGPGSALHGADAFSGVINIVSKKHDNTVDQVGARYGSFNTWEAWVNQSVSLDKFSLGLSLSLMQSDGDDDRVVVDRGGKKDSMDTRYDTVFLHADMSYKEIEANLLIERSQDLGLGVGHRHNLDPDGYFDRDKILADIKHTNRDWFDDTTVKSRVHFSYSDMHAQYNPFNQGPFTWRSGEPNPKEYRTGFSSGAIYKGVDNHTINFKFGYEYSKLDPSQRKNFGPDVVAGEMTDITDNPNAVYMLEHTRRSYYGLLQDEYLISKDLAITAGARYDYYDDFGSTVNPRLALVWQESEDITLKAMYGRAFRAPSFGELYLINNPALRGNPDLDPETIDTYEVALNYRAKVHTKLNLFYYKAKNLIDYAPDSSTGPIIQVAQNIKDQTGYGLELELEHALTETVSLRGNYSYQHSENSDTHERVANAPMHQAFAQVQYKPDENWNTNMQYFYIGKRYRESGDSRSALGSDSLVNLTIERKNISKMLDGLLSARNLFDADYREPSTVSSGINDDYPMPGIYLFAELRYRF